MIICPSFVSEVPYRQIYTMKKSQDHPASDVQAALARITMIEEKFQSISDVLNRLMADIGSVDSQTPKAVVSKLMELQTAHLSVIKAQEAFHEKFKDTDPSGGVDYDEIRVDIGRLQSPLATGPLGTWDRQAGVSVTLISGMLASLGADVVFAGGNTIAIGDGVSDNWEIVQFADADPIGNCQYEIRNLLRGQLGTSAMMPRVWPAGSIVVVLDGHPEQITIPSASRGLERHYRYGPAKQAVRSASYKYTQRSFAGNGYRPYPVVHLNAAPDPSGMTVNWIRAPNIPHG